jgi:hypothetical protein
VLRTPEGSDYAIWLVAFVLYVVDAARLLLPRELLLVEDGRRRLTAVFSLSPFTIAGRVLAFGPLLLPHRGVFVAPWTRPWVAEARLASRLEGVWRLTGALLVTRILAVWTFGLLFVIGPALTLVLGPDAAVVCVAAGVYPTAMVTIAHLWWRRRAFQLTVARAAWLSIEMLVCPAFLPNLVRKITTAHPLDVDGAQILAAAARSEVREQLLPRLESRTEELLADTSAESAEQRDLRSYLSRLRAAQTVPAECVP